MQHFQDFSTYSEATIYEDLGTFVQQVKNLKIDFSLERIYRFLFPEDLTTEEIIVRGSQYTSLLSSFFGARGRGLSFGIETVLFVYWIYKFQTAKTENDKFSAICELIFGLIILIIPTVKFVRSRNFATAFLAHKSGQMTMAQVQSKYFKNLDKTSSDQILKAARTSSGTLSNGIRALERLGLLPSGFAARATKYSDEVYQFINKLTGSSAKSTSIKAGNATTAKLVGPEGLALTELGANMMRKGLKNSDEVVELLKNSESLQKKVVEVLKDESVDNDSILAILSQFAKDPKKITTILDEIPGRGGIGILNGVSKMIDPSMGVNIHRASSVTGFKNILKNEIGSGAISTDFLSRVKIPLNGKQVPIGQAVLQIENRLVSGAKEGLEYAVAGGATFRLGKGIIGDLTQSGFKFFSLPGKALSKSLRNLLKIFTYLNRQYVVQTTLDVLGIETPTTDADENAIMDSFVVIRYLTDPNDVYYARDWKTGKEPVSQKDVVPTIVGVQLNQQQFKADGFLEGYSISDEHMGWNWYKSIAANSYPVLELRYFALDGTDLYKMEINAENKEISFQPIKEAFSRIRYIIVPQEKYKSLDEITQSNLEFAKKIYQEYYEDPTLLDKFIKGFKNVLGSEDNAEQKEIERKFYITGRDTFQNS